MLASQDQENTLRCQFAVPQTASLTMDRIQRLLCKLVKTHLNLDLQDSHFTGYFRLEEHYSVYLKISPEAPVSPTQYVLMMAEHSYQNILTGINSFDLSDPNMELTRIFLNYYPLALIEDKDSMTEICKAVLLNRQTTATLIKKVKR